MSPTAKIALSKVDSTCSNFSLFLCEYIKKEKRKKESVDVGVSSVLTGPIAFDLWPDMGNYASPSPTLRIDVQLVAYLVAAEAKGKSMHHFRPPISTSGLSFSIAYKSAERGHFIE